MTTDCHSDLSSLPIFWNWRVINGGSVYGKANTLLILTKEKDDNYGIIDTIYLYLKIHMKQNINILLKKAKIMVLKSEKSQDFYQIFKQYSEYW